MQLLTEDIAKCLPPLYSHEGQGENAETDLPWPAVLRYAWQETQAGFAALIEVVVESGHVGSLLTLVLGRPLIWLNYNQSDKEAVFRADLIHVRENAESLALSHREPLVRARLLRHLDELAANFKQNIAVRSEPRLLHHGLQLSDSDHSGLDRCAALYPRRG